MLGRSVLRHHFAVLDVVNAVVKEEAAKHQSTEEEGNAHCTCSVRTQTQDARERLSQSSRARLMRLWNPLTEAQLPSRLSSWRRKRKQTRKLHLLHGVSADVWS
jgi:hypothetical protein